MSDVMCLIITWDWKGQPDIAAINDAMATVYNGSNRPLIQEVPNTGSDQCAIIVSSGPTDPQAAWHRRFYGGEDWDDAAPFWMGPTDHAQQVIDEDVEAWLEDRDLAAGGGGRAT